MRIKENFNEIIFPMLSQSLKQMELFETRRGLIQLLLTKGYTQNSIKGLLNSLTFQLFQEDFEDYYYNDIPMRELYLYIKKLQEPQLLEFIASANVNKRNSNFNNKKKSLSNETTIPKKSNAKLSAGYQRSKLKETITQYKSMNIVKEILTLFKTKDISGLKQSKIIPNRNFSLDKEILQSKHITLHNYCGIEKMRDQLNMSTIVANNQKKKLILNLQSFKNFQKNKVNINSKESINEEQLLNFQHTEIREIKKSLTILKEIISFYKVIAKKQKIHYVE